MNEVIVRRRGCLHGGTRRDPTLPPPESWPTGRELVGRAWSEEVFIRAVGPECRDGTYGLTPEQQARYAHIQVVAAPPVRNGQAEIIWVVPATSLQDNGRLVDQDGYVEMVLVPSSSPEA